MYREIVKINKEIYTLHLPKEYINKEVEILIFPIYRKNKTKKNFQKISKKTSGILAKHNIDPLKWQKEIRKEWDEREDLLNRF